jgi:hypothetical protein
MGDFLSNSYSLPHFCGSYKMEMLICLREDGRMYPEGGENDENIVSANV